MTDPKAANNFIARHPVSSFIILTLIISYLFGIPFQSFMLPVVADKHEVFAGLVPRIVVVYGPAFAAMTVALFSAGTAGLRNLLRKLIPRSTHMLWIIAIPFICAFMTFASFVISGMPVRSLNELLVNDGHLLLLQLLGQLLIVGIGEELGWRGWLLPKLTQRHGMGISVLFIVLIWGSWHLPVFMSPPEILVPWCMMLIALSFITAWLWYKVKGNVFVLAVAHASINAPAVFLENRLRHLEAGDHLFISGWGILGYAYMATALILFLRTRKFWMSRALAQTKSDWLLWE